jgi:hypothetical protein
MKIEKPMKPKPKLQRCKTPKRIWIYSLQKPGMVSVGEYIRTKRFNIVDPFNVHEPDKAPYGYLRMRMDNYQRLNNNRPIVAVISRDDFNAKHVADVLEIPIE